MKRVITSHPLLHSYARSWEQTLAIIPCRQQGRYSSMEPYSTHLIWKSGWLSVHVNLRGNCMWIHSYCSKKSHSAFYFEIKPVRFIPVTYRIRMDHRTLLLARGSIANNDESRNLYHRHKKIRRTQIYTLRTIKPTNIYIHTCSLHSKSLRFIYNVILCYWIAITNANKITYT
jgi:hypothetical protein